MTNSNLTPATSEQQQLEAARLDKLSCLFDVDSHVQALPPPPTPARTQAQPTLSLPNHNPLPADAAALQALGLTRPRRKKPGGSRRQPLPTQEPSPARDPGGQSTAFAGQPPFADQPFDGDDYPRPSARRQRVTLVGLCRWLYWYVSTKPTDAVQYPAFVVLGVVARLVIASNSFGVTCLVVASLGLTVVVGLCRTGWRELLLSSCLLVGVLLAGVFG